jgi:hypothetical protein
MDVWTDPFVALIFYFSLLSVAFGLAWVSDNDAYLRLGVIAVGHWMVYEWLLLRQLDNWVLIAAISCVAGTLSAWLGREAKRVAIATTALWIIGAVIAAIFFCFGAEGSMPCYLMLNATFIARMLILGGSGIAELAGRGGVMPLRHLLRRDGP